MTKRIVMIESGAPRCSENIRQQRQVLRGRDDTPEGQCKARAQYALDGKPMCRLHAMARAFEIVCQIDA